MKKTFGQIAYEAARNHALENGLKNASRIAPWEDSPHELKAVWESAALAVLASQWRPVTEPPQYESMRVLLRGGGHWTAIEAFAERSRLRTHWAEIPPFMEPTDPYADLKAAYAAGKVIQEDIGLGDWCDLDDQKPFWNLHHSRYRIKPWTLSRHIPGFRPLEPGEEWHRATDWTEALLPDGHRPLLVGENREPEDENQPSGGYGFSKHSEHIRAGLWRTTRPMPPTREELELAKFNAAMDTLGYKITDEKLRQWALVGWKAAHKKEILDSKAFY